MATLALGTLGAAFGPAGQIVGGLLGSFIDQQIMSLFQDPIEGPRIDEFRIPNYDEGRPIPWVQGQRVRVPGTIIWISPRRETTNTSGGGKGGGGGSPPVTTYDYFYDVAVAFCRQECETALPIKKLWANSSPIVEVEASFNRTSNDITVSPQTIKAYLGPDASCANVPVTEYLWFRNPGTTAGQANFFRDVKVGEEIRVSGNTNAVNNGLWIVDYVYAPITSAYSSIRVVRCRYDYTYTYGAAVPGVFGLPPYT